MVIYMENDIRKCDRVYMIGCGKTNLTCREYEMKINGDEVSIYDGKQYICTYTKSQMCDFMSIGFAALI